MKKMKNKTNADGYGRYEDHGTHDRNGNDSSHGTHEIHGRHGSHGRHRSRRKARRAGKVLALLLALIATGGALFWMYSDSREGEKTGTEKGEAERQYREVTVDGQDYVYNTDLVTVLALGIDAEKGSMSGQADSISLVVFDRGEERIRVIGISRDSMVPVRVFDALGNSLGWDTQHLALSYAYGHTGTKGCLLAQEAVSKMFHGIPIIYYGAANLSALPEFHDLVGEITIRLPEEMKGELDDDLYNGDTLSLTSENVERFLRERDTGKEFSNTGRMERQKLYIGAYLEKLKGLLEEDFSGMLSRMEAVLPDTVTNIRLNEVSSFAEMALEYGFDPETDYYTVRGTDRSGAYHDEFLVDEDALQQLVLEIFYRKKTGGRET